MAAAAILNFFRIRVLRVKVVWGTLFSMSVSNLVQIRSKMVELWPFYWFQNGGRRHLEFLPTMSTSWPEHCVKISCQSIYYCRRYDHLIIWQIWLKTPIPAPKCTFWGVLPPKHYFSLQRPSKGTSLAETASYEPLSVAIRRGVSSGWRDKNTKKQTKGSPDEVTNWVLAPPTPLILS